jgi:hypothetical protein
MHATGGILTRNPNKRAAADQRFSTVHVNKITHEETTNLLVRSDKRTSYPTLMASGITLLSRTCTGHLRIKVMLKEQRGTTEVFGKLLYVPHSHTHILLRDFRAKLETQGISKLRIGEDNLDEIIKIIVTQQDTLPQPRCNLEYYNASILEYT